MNVIEAIENKRAIRSFKQKPLPEPVVRAILDAGRRAQSSKNTQPWQFIAVQDKERLAALSKLGKYASHVKDAALAIVLAGPAGVEFDLGQAAAYMQLAALEHGVGSCLVAIYEPGEARKLLNVPDGYQMHIAIDFGYPSKTEQEKTLGKGRKDLQDVTHWETW